GGPDRGGVAPTLGCKRIIALVEAEHRCGYVTGVATYRQTTAATPVLTAWLRGPVVTRAEMWVTQGSLSAWSHSRQPDRVGPPASGSTSLETWKKRRGCGSKPIDVGVVKWRCAAPITATSRMCSVAGACTAVSIMVEGIFVRHRPGHCQAD